METKKAKCTKLTKSDTKDNYGNTSFSIEFDNGDRGWYKSKKEDQTNFVAGQEQTYCIEEKVSGTGTKYYRITLPQTEQSFKPGGGGRPQQDPKVQFISFAASYAKDLIVGGKVQLIDFESQMNRIYNAMIAKL